MGQATNLPASLPPLVGRENDIAAGIAKLMCTRLLTLTGPGGVGKTCLALHIAQQMVCESHIATQDGAWWVELASVSDPALLPQALVLALPVPDEDPGLSLTDALLGFLGNRHILLLLDNCEHLLSACSEWVECLLQSCPHLSILTTSREALRSPYEQLWPVAPLTVPHQTDCATGEQAQTFAAVQLFVERASQVLPTFQLDQQCLRSVIRICHTLDGLPLAIELAAACVTFLTPEQIALQLDQGFNVLTHGHRTALLRQKTLEATMAWSYHLLSPGEQALFCQLSVLPGTFSRELVVTLDGRTSGAACADLWSLIEKSLVSVVRSSGEVRYRMLEMLRHYGHQQLVLSGTEQMASDRFGLWIEQLVEAALSKLEGPEQATWLDRLQAEIGHLRAVLHWMLDSAQIERALSLSISLVGFWRQRGYLREGQHWLEMLLAAYSPSHVHCFRSSHYAPALNALGVLLMWQGAYERAETLHRDALLVFQEHNHRRGMAATLFRLGFLADKQRDYTRATDYFEQSQRLSAEAGDLQCLDMVSNRLGIVAWNQGRCEEATALLEQSLRVQRAQGHLGGLASTLLNLGVLVIEQGRLLQGTAYLQESLQLNRQLKDRLATAYALTYLGYASMEYGDDQQSAQCFHEALIELDVLDLESYQTIPELLSRLIDGIGAVLARHSLTLRAAQLWGAMDMLRQKYRLAYRSTEQVRYDREVATAQAAGSTEAFLQAWSAGGQMTVQEVWASVTGELISLRSSGAEVAAQIVPVSQIATCPVLRISGLGTLQIYRREQLVTSAELIYTKAQELLFYLLSNPRRTKAQIALALWPDATSNYVQTTFRVILYHLRRALGGSEWILRDQQSYAFNRSLEYWYDVESFVTLVQDAEQQRLAGNSEQAVASLESAVALYRGDFGVGLPMSDWMIQQQETLWRMNLEARLVLGDLYVSQRKVRQALSTFLDITHRDKYCEAAYRGAIRCYGLLQESGAARNQYERLRHCLYQELGAHPSAETESLLQAML